MTTIFHQERKLSTTRYLLCLVYRWTQPNRIRLKLRSVSGGPIAYKFSASSTTPIPSNTSALANLTRRYPDRCCCTTLEQATTETNRTTDHTSWLGWLMEQLFRRRTMRRNINLCLQTFPPLEAQQSILLPTKLTGGRVYLGAGALARFITGITRDCNDRQSY